MKISKKENLTGLAVVIPMMIYFAIFTLVPFVFVFYFSFTDLGFAYGTQHYNGFKNYINIFKYHEYIDSIITTLIMAIALVIVGMVLGFFLALMLNSLTKFKGILRTIWYIPVLLSMAVTSKIVGILLGPYGSLNKILESIGLSAIGWFDSTFWMYFWIIFVVTWKGLGSTALLYMAGLNGIPQEIYEAAEIDGASRIKKMVSITLPMLRPMIGFILITGFIGAFGIFEPVQLISEGGPDGATKVILYRIYDEAFKNSNQGFACALSVFVMLIMMVLTYFNMKFTDSDMFGVRRKK